MTTTDTALRWVERGRDFFSSADGRFDLLWSKAVGLWVCIDWDARPRPRKVRGEKAACVAWCVARLREGRG